MLLLLLPAAKIFGRAGQGNIFDVGSGSMGNAAEYGVFAAVSLFDNHVFYIINVVSVIAVSTFHNVGTGFSIDNIIAGCADQMVIAVAAIDGLAAFSMLSQGISKYLAKLFTSSFCVPMMNWETAGVCTVLSVLVLMVKTVLLFSRQSASRDRRFRCFGLQRLNR